MSQQSAVGSLEGLAGPKQANRPRRYVAILSIAILAVIVVGAIAIFLVTDRQQAKQAAIQGQCGGRNAEAAYTALTTGDRKALLSQADAIRAVEGYESSSTCLYIVTEADIALGDGEAAKAHYAVLTKLLADGQTLDGAFDRPHMQVEATKDAIDFMLSGAGVQTEGESGLPPEVAGNAEGGRG